jgi:hypothetical protein
VLSVTVVGSGFTTVVVEQLEKMRAAKLTEMVWMMAFIGRSGFGLMLDLKNRQQDGRFCRTSFAEWMPEPKTHRNPLMKNAPITLSIPIQPAP